MSIHSGANFYVHPNEDITIFSDLNNSGSFGSYPGAVVEFFGQRWTNRSGGRLNDNSPGGLLGNGGTFRFAGNTPQYLNNQTNSITNLSFPSLIVANRQNIVLEGSSAEVRNNLLFETGHIVLNNRDLVLGTNSTISGYGDGKFVITGTGSTGGFIRKKSNGTASGEMVFPVGTAPGSYNPLALSYKGVPQTIGVRVFENVYDKAIFGVPNNQNVVARTWNLNYTNLDPNAVSSLRLQHNQGEEMPDFILKRMQSFVSRYDAVKELWDKSTEVGLSQGSINTGGPLANAFVNTRLSVKGVGLNEYFSKSVLGSSALAGLRIPEGISPNDDGLNDKFVIQNLASTDKVRIDIYNRWQTLVYRSLDYKNDFSGIGNQNGLLSNELPDGTYYYILNINSEKPVTGHIIINR